MKVSEQQHFLTAFSFVFFFCSLLLLPKIPVHAAASLNLGILGDSNTDEYRADDNRAGGTQYASTTLNWAELLVNKKNVNLGVWGTWGGSRRSGYKYNWARSGATSTDLISAGQHTGLAQQIANGEVQYAVIFIGSNDFHSWNGTYNEVYSNILSDAQVQQKVNTIVSNITLAVDTLLAAGPVKIVLANYPDPALSIDFQAQFPDAQKRLRVSSAIQKVNQGLITMSAARHIVLADLSGMATTILALVDSNGSIVINGEHIALTPHSDEPHHLQLSDSVGHAGTVMGGFEANLFINALSSGYGINLIPFSNQEILQNAGISTTTTTKIGDANTDGKVNGQDYIIWLNNYGITNPTGQMQGDFNKDSKVDGKDYVLWLNNYGL